MAYRCQRLRVVRSDTVAARWTVTASPRNQQYAACSSGYPLIAARAAWHSATSRVPSPPPRRPEVPPACSGMCRAFEVLGPTAAMSAWAQVAQPNRARDPSPA
jgi:hypothetical protein